MSIPQRLYLSLLSTLCHQFHRYDPRCDDLPLVAPVDDAVFAACSGGQLFDAGESWMYVLLRCRCPAVTADGAVASPAATGVIRCSGGSGSQNCGVAPRLLGVGINGCGAGRNGCGAGINGTAGCRAAPLRYCTAIGFGGCCITNESFESCDVSVGCVGASAACV